MALAPPLVFTCTMVPGMRQKLPGKWYHRVPWYNTGYRSQNPKIPPISANTAWHTRIPHRHDVPGTGTHPILKMCHFFIIVFYFFNSIILRRMGQSKSLKHHTFTYFNTRRVSIELSCFRNPALAGVSFGSHYSDSVSCPYFIYIYLKGVSRDNIHAVPFLGVNGKSFFQFRLQVVATFH